MRDRPQGEVGAQPDRKPAAALGGLLRLSDLPRFSVLKSPRSLAEDRGFELRKSGTIGNNPRPLPRRLFSDFARSRPLLADSSGTVNSRRPGPRPGPRPCEATFGCPAPAKSSVPTRL